ncbi:MAG: type II toxin-antitoxin system PemK/MazF family toxin [Patescibacteria group bacterium]|nr:type II toxin-antitoxin system PemK/MazF family toxin [Patescibacteria group bacterium]
MIKKFLEWIGLKEQLHVSEHVPPFFKEGEIWWCYIGENIGIEANGKGTKFTRPVLVMKKYDKFSFFAIPLTSKRKFGTWYYNFVHDGLPQNAQLAQGRVVSYKRLKERVGKIVGDDYEKLVDSFITLHKNRPPSRDGVVANAK